MFDFTTATSAPVTIVRINGTEYRLPRFLLPAMSDWSAERRKATSDEATAHLNDDDKARFLQYFPAPLIDIAEAGPWAVSTEGAPVVFTRQAKLAGVPDNLIEAVIAQTDPMGMRALAKELCSAQQASDSAKGLTDGDKSPLAEPPAGSQDSPGTGAPNTPASAPATPESTQAA